VRSSVAVTSSITSRLSALRCAGRLRVIRATAPSRRKRTGPAAVSVVSSTLMPATIRPSAQHEAEARPAAGARGAYVHDQRAVEDAVGSVARLAGEVELRREDLPVRALHLDVDVAGGPGGGAGGAGTRACGGGGASGWRRRGRSSAAPSARGRRRTDGRAGGSPRCRSARSRRPA